MTIHDSDTCTAGKFGQPCVMCRFAREFEKSGARMPSEASGVENQPVGFLESETKNVPQGEYGAGIGISAPDFDHHWNAALPARRRYTEQSEAEHWFRRGLWVGIQYERERGLVAMNGDLKEMQRMARERMGR